METREADGTYEIGMNTNSVSEQTINMFLSYMVDV